jgi:uncharacterized Zn finger protein
MVQSQFDLRVQQRGSEYFVQNRISSLYGGPSFAEATAEGSALYDVSIDFAGATLA